MAIDLKNYKGMIQTTVCSKNQIDIELRQETLSNSNIASTNNTSRGYCQKGNI